MVAPKGTTAPGTEGRNPARHQTGLQVTADEPQHLLVFNLECHACH